MDWSSILTAVISALSGGLLASIFTYKISNRKQNQNEFKSLVDEYKILNSGCKKELEDLSGKVELLQNGLNRSKIEVLQLRNQLMIFESSHIDIPLPVWLKDTDGKMIFLNDEYERELLFCIDKTREDYIGLTDADVWGVQVGVKFKNNDLEVVRKKKSLEFTEEWVAVNGKKFNCTVIKYPRFIDKTVIGIGGIITDIECS